MIREFSAPRRPAPGYAPPRYAEPRYAAPRHSAAARGEERSEAYWRGADRARRFSPLPFAMEYEPLRRLDAGRGDLRAATLRQEPTWDREPTSHSSRSERRRPIAGPRVTSSAGIATATNYCVRLCDGYAFPVGEASGNWAVQEHTCRQACPGAETALYSAPAGAKDFDALTRGNASYSALPNAFRYRDKLDNACRCHAPGYATTPSSVLSDLTLRHGDLIVSRVGFRHFQGSAQLPYKPANFSDAVLSLNSPREVQIVRAMEAVSVRGEMLPNAPDYLRDRVTSQIRSANKEARQHTFREPVFSNLGRGFEELQARERSGKTTLKVVPKSSGFVALN